MTNKTATESKSAPRHRKPKPGQSLAEVNPELAKQWHPTKNGAFTAYDVTAGGTVRILV